MKFLITSDSHGQTTELTGLYERHKGEVDLFLHAGDSELDPEHEAMKPFLSVAGNCDIPSEGFPDVRVEATGPLSVLLTHGHLYQIKMSPLPLSYKAEEAGAQIICYGHTHSAGAHLEGGKLFINPGSLRLPRQPRIPTYAIVDVSESKNVKVIFYDAEGKLYNDLTEEFKLD